MVHPDGQLSLLLQESIGQGATRNHSPGESRDQRVHRYSEECKSTHVALYCVVYFDDGCSY